MNTRPSARLVAQTGSLLYRGLTIRILCRFERLADCQSATQQTASLRYLSIDEH